MGGGHSQDSGKTTCSICEQKIKFSPGIFIDSQYFSSWHINKSLFDVDGS